MMRMMYVDDSGQVELLTEIPPGWDKDSPKKGELLWIDLNQAENKASVEQFLTRQFNFHPLAIDDALNEEHLPKVDDWETYLYIALQDLTFDAAAVTVTMPELDLFLGQQYLVTYHPETVTAVDCVWQLCQRNSRWLQHGADHLLYRLIDEMVNNYTAVLDQLESRILQLETQIFTQPASPLLENMTHYKRTVLESVNEFRFLGNLLSQNGNLLSSAEALSKKALKVMYSIKSYTSDLNELPAHLSVHLFDSVVRPILTYNCEIWYMDVYKSYNNHNKAKN